MSYQITEEDIKRTKILASKMFKKWEPGLVSFDDILGDGLEGLIRAAQKYDESKVNPDRDDESYTRTDRKFWAYATPSVKGFMLNGFRKRFGERMEKLAMVKAESLSINEADDPDSKPLELSVEETWNSGMPLLEKIRSIDLTLFERQTLIMLAGGYSQVDIARQLGVNKRKVYHVTDIIRRKFSMEEFAEMIER